MISKKMSSELNKQLNKEYYSAYFYLAMAAYTESLGFKGFAHWFHIQFNEELDHAKKFYKYIVDQNEKVILEKIDKPEGEFESLKDVFKKTYTHEQYITKCINQLMDLSLEEKDHATRIFLQWFVTEQMEEENMAKDVMDKLELGGDKGQGLLMLDSILGRRE